MWSRLGIPWNSNIWLLFFLFKLKLHVFLLPSEAAKPCNQEYSDIALAMSAHQLKAAEGGFYYRAVLMSFIFFTHNIHSAGRLLTRREKHHWFCWWVKKSRKHTFTVLPTIDFLKTTTRPIKIVKMYIIKCITYCKLTDKKNMIRWIKCKKWS